MLPTRRRIENEISVTRCELQRVLISLNFRTPRALRRQGGKSTAPGPPVGVSLASVCSRCVIATLLSITEDVVHEHVDASLCAHRARGRHCRSQCSDRLFWQWRAHHGGETAAKRCRGHRRDRIARHDAWGQRSRNVGRGQRRSLSRCGASGRCSGASGRCSGASGRCSGASGRCSGRRARQLVIVPRGGSRGRRRVRPPGALERGAGESIEGAHAQRTLLDELLHQRTLTDELRHRGGSTAPVDRRLRRFRLGHGRGSVNTPDALCEHPLDSSRRGGRRFGRRSRSADGGRNGCGPIEVGQLAWLTGDWGGPNSAGRPAPPLRRRRRRSRRSGRNSG
jgi:hypothetical protein